MQLTYDIGRPTQTGGDEESYSIVGGVSGAKGNVTFGFSADQKDIIYHADRSLLRHRPLDLRISLPATSPT